jgi:hypothetical protein
MTPEFYGSSRRGLKIYLGTECRPPMRAREFVGQRYSLIICRPVSGDGRYVSEQVEPYAVPASGLETELAHIAKRRLYTSADPAKRRELVLRIEGLCTDIPKEDAYSTCYRTSLANIWGGNRLPDTECEPDITGTSIHARTLGNGPAPRPGEHNAEPDIASTRHYEMQLTR